MQEKRRAEVRTIVDRFRGKAVTQNVINEFCNRNKIETITVGELQDYTYQVEHDEKVQEVFPLILTELQKLRYNAEFAPEGQRRKVREGNDEVRVNITKLFEEHGITYRMVDSLANELGNMVGGAIATAGTTAFNKALDVLLHIARQKFGGEFTMKHAADYAREVYGKAIDKEEKEG